MLMFNYICIFSYRRHMSRWQGAHAAPPPFGKILKSWIFSIEACIQMTFLCPRNEESGGILIYPCPSVLSSIRPDVDTWFVRLSPPTVLELQL